MLYVKLLILPNENIAGEPKTNNYG